MQQVVLQQGRSKAGTGDPSGQLPAGSPVTGEARPDRVLASIWHAFWDWARAARLERKLAVLLLVGAVASGVATYMAMTGAFTATPQPRTILLLLLLNLILLLLLVTVVARRLVLLWLERRRGMVGARLHVRLVMWFALAAMVPTIIVATFSALFLNLGMDAWFSDRVRSAVKDSLIVAQSYLAEHQERLATDALSIVDSLHRGGPLFFANRDQIEALLANQAALRDLSDAAVVNGARQVVARTGLSLLLEFDTDLPEWAMVRARAGEVVILSSGTEDRVRALVRLDRYPESYLLIGRMVDTRVLAHVDKATGAAQIYEQLEGRRSGLQITFALIFIVVALLVLFAAVWAALIVATNLARPIAGLAVAAERVGAGDLTARVIEGRSQDEIGALTSSFNRMAERLQTQQDALIAANEQVENRRRFSELVLSGVSAGVVGLDAEGRITLPNRSASDLLGLDLGLHLGEPLAGLVPEMGNLIGTAQRRAPRVAEGQINHVRDGSQQTLLVRVAAGSGAPGEVGYVLTFDDVTDLLSAQRTAAWADVARRIAHEIKNPLTPIQLAAERLKRKYLKEITSDPETFAVCTDTIVRHVGDIGRMVDEFSSFARMPAPIMRPENLEELCRSALFLQQSAHPGIGYTSAFPDQPVVMDCDAQQVSRALTNLLQNAADALETLEPTGGNRIDVKLWQQSDRIVIAIEDDGPGLPVKERGRLTEPYVTTRVKGTGLGLAIVKKIMEDHGGDLILDDRAGGGASVKLVFMRRTPEEMLPDMRAGAAHGA